ncbi:hypothetical protein STEG23_030467, partial [Scotinomys teguina]
MIGHSSSHGYGRVQTTELPSMWRKPTATAFIHQKHWKDISPSQSLQVLEISPEEKLCKSPHVNEAYTSLCFDQPQERTQTGENLNENDLTRDTYGQNGEVIHTEVKQFVGQLCKEAFSNSSDLVNHENSHIGKKRDNCRQPGHECGIYRPSLRTQVIKKECGYACDSDCDNNLDLDAETFINIDMHPIGSVHESPLYVRNMIGHSSSHGYGRVQTTESPSMWRKPTATAFIHQNHWKNISPSQSLQVLKISPEEKLCKSQQFNEACTSLCFDQPQERTQTGENLNENDLTRDTYGQNGEVIHTEVKQFVGQLCEEAFSNSSDLINHENSYIGKKRANCRQSGKRVKCGKCFEKHKVPFKGEKPYACQHCGKDFSVSSSCKRHDRGHTAEKQFTFSYHRHLKSHDHIHTGEKPYACEHCGKAFNRCSDLKSHDQIHTGEKPYACVHCGKAFNRCNDLKSHDQIHTGEKPYACEHCGKAFNRCSDLKSHDQIHTGEKPYACEHCGKAFNSYGDLKVHVRIHTGEKPYACKHCGKAFTKSFHLKTHERIHTGEKPYACKHCGKTFTQSSHLKTHERIHTGEKPYACKHCGKTFTQSTHLKTHERIHTGEKPYACEHCGKAFKSYGNLKFHEQIHTGGNPYASKHCGKAFTRSCYLKRHEQLHIGDKPYSCEHCGKAFNRRSQLKSHERIHTGEKPYAYKHCGKTSTQSFHLKRHVLIHTGEKPYACKHCGKVFTQSSCLKRHTLIHIGEKTYPCKHCGKAFNWCSELKIHERIHTGEKPYACKYCGKAFAHSSSLKTHVQIHIGEKPYACKHCGKRFTSSRTQGNEKERGYACDNDCDKNLDPDPENIINIDNHPIVSVHESPLCVRNMTGHSSSYGYGRVQTTELPSEWKKPTPTSFLHQKHWKDISHSQSLQVLEISPEEKLCKSQQFNEACTSLCFDHPQERTQTGENLNENDLTRDMYGQNGELIHKEVKQFVGQLCEEAFSNSSDLINHENSHIGKERANSRQSGKTLKYAKCFEKHK